MKILLLTIFSALIFVTAANAQLIEQQCSVSSVDVTNTIADSVHTKLLYRFECKPAAVYEGQVTKMLVKIPYIGLENVKASDPYGEMVVLEGPGYVKTEESETETSIGVIFRRGLIIGSEGSLYSVSVEFNAASLVKDSESGREIKPGNLVENVKITIISTGIMETTIPVSRISYTLNLPEGSSITQITPKGCELVTGVVSCGNMTLEEYKKVEVKWKQSPASIQWGNKIREYTKDLLPKISSLFKKVLDKVKDLKKSK